MGFKAGKGDQDGDLIIRGTTPKITVGDGGEEDTMIVFDGAAQDYRIGLDDGTDTLEIGHGAAHGTRAAIIINSSGDVTKIGTDTHTSGQFLKYDGSKFVLSATSGGTADSIAADDITAGDAAVTIATTSGDITIDAAANNSDIILKGTDGGADTTFLTIDGSEAGQATFNAGIIGTSFSGSGDINLGKNLYLYGTMNVTGALTAASTISGSAALSIGAGATLAGALNLQAGGITNAGAIAAATTISGSGALSVGGGATLAGALNLQASGITNAGAVAGATTVSGSGNADFGGILKAGNSGFQADADGDVTVKTLTSSANAGSSFGGGLTLGGALALQSAGVTAAGSIAGATSISGSGDLNLGKNMYLHGTLNVTGAATFGINDTGVDVRIFSATTNEGVLYDSSEDELALLLTTKLKFHDVGGGEEIFASANGHLEVNAGTTLDMTAPTVDVNASTAVTVDTPGVTITDSTASSATEGGFIRLVSDDGAAMANDHRLGVLEFAGAEDASSTITVGAKIEAICDDNWSATENGTALVMSTTDANASQSEVLRLDSDKLATFAGAALFSGNATFGVDDTGVDVRLFSATASEGVLYDASEDELALLLTTKLKFHDVGGGEEIYASADGHLEVNSGTTLDMTAPTIDINASTAVTVDSDLVTFGSANAADPLVIIKNTTDDTASARLRFVKDRGAAGEDNDNIGTIEFYGDDDAQDNIEFASIGAQVADASNGAEGGRLVLRVATHDGEMQSGLTIQDGDAEDEVDVTIGNGAASLTTIAGEMKVTEDFFHGDAKRVIYEEVDVRKCDTTDNTVSVQFGNKIPQDSVVTRVVAMVKTASNLGTHNVNIRFDVGDGRAADYNAASTSSEALGGGASTTRSSTNVGSAVDIDLTAAKESYINDTPSFMTTADVYPYVMNAGTSNGTSDASSGTLLIYIEYYGIDQSTHFTTS